MVRGVLGHDDVIRRPTLQGCVFPPLPVSRQIASGLHDDASIGFSNCLLIQILSHLYAAPLHKTTFIGRPRIPITIPYESLGGEKKSEEAQRKSSRLPIVDKTQLWQGTPR